MADERLRLREVEILALSDAAGTSPVPLSRLFPGVGAAAWAPYRALYPGFFVGEDAVPHNVGCFLVRFGGRTLLVDTGIGPALGPFTGRLPQELAARGVRPEDVELVVLTHAHIDHIGWNVAEGGAPTFPRARYLLHEADWAALPRLEAGRAPYADHALAPLRALGVLELLTGETPLAEGVVALPTPGHTPGHMSVLVGSGGEEALIAGDVLNHPVQVSEPGWRFAFDLDHAQAVATRERLLGRAEAAGLTLAPSHFPSPGYGRVARVEGKRVFQAL